MERGATGSPAPGAGCARPGEGAAMTMTDTLVALMLAVVLAAAIVAPSFPPHASACRPDDAASIERGAQVTVLTLRRVRYHFVVTPRHRAHDVQDPARGRGIGATRIFAAHRCDLNKRKTTTDRL